MKFITSFLLSFSLLISSLNPFVPVTAVLKAGSSTKNNKVQETEIDDTNNMASMSENNIEDTSKEGEIKTKNFIDYDFEGYCTLSVPQSHYTINTGTSTEVLKNFTYKDKKTKLTMSYVTNISVDADIPGYITIDVAGVDTVTNGKQEEIYGDNRTWMKVPSTEKEDGCNVYVWYTLSENKTSAFWVKAKVAPDSDDAEFYEVIRQMFNSYNYYQYGSGVLFETPSTGWYAGKDFNNGTIGDTTQYKANDRAFTVFQTRGGYIEGADIAENWQDLEMIIDGVKFRLPCTLKDFYDAGFAINDRSLTEDQLTVPPDNTLKLKLINAKGTVVTVTCKNESGTQRKHAEACSLVTILLDRREFVSMADVDVVSLGLQKASEEQKEQEQKEQEEQENMDEESENNENEDESSENTDENSKENSENNDENESDSSDSKKEEKESDSKQKDKSNEEESDNDKENSEDESAEGDEESTDEEKKDSEETGDDNDSKKGNKVDKAEKVDEIEEEQEEEKLGNITDKLELDDNYKDHEMIIAGGVTWGVYTDDAITYFGNNVKKTKWNGGEQYKLTWEDSERRMNIVIGILHTIQSVELTCDAYD